MSESNINGGKAGQVQPSRKTFIVFTLCEKIATSQRSWHFNSKPHGLAKTDHFINTPAHASLKERM